jgi:outer membrane protein OmpA-like peptidoglycan-associated protein/Tol biopolymer transport system component
MKKYLFIFFSFFFIKSFSQTYQPDKVNPKALKIYDDAIEKLRDDQFKEAIPLLQKAIAIDKNYVDAYLSLAGTYGQLKDYQKAIDYYELARTKDTNYFRVYLLPYSINLAGMGKFDEALNAVNNFLSITNLSSKSVGAASYRKTCYQFAIDYKTKHSNSSYIFTPFNLGDSVNSQYLEYLPTLTVDDSLLVFTRRQNGREDFMQCTITKNGFTKAKPIGGDLNMQPFKGGVTVSSDGEWLIFAGDFSGGFGSFDLYISYATPQGWSEPQNLGENINSHYWESSPSLSPDNRMLYFSSNRPGGYGGADLYVSVRQPNGKWSVAKNMGKTINSIGDETAPYVHADNQTLYYTSTGLPGYGGSDLFVSRKNILGEWEAPENLGYPINTIDNEGSIAVSSDGSTAYYASDRSDTRGGLDLYKFDLREDIRPHKTLYVKGKVFDAKTNKGIPCAVELIDNSNNKVLVHLQTDELGKYFIPLPTGKDYTFTVNRKGYLFYSELYELNKKQSDSTYTKNISLQPITLNASVVFKNIQFETNSYKLLSVSLIELDKLLQLLNENPSINIEIAGHTDNVGKAEDNIKLSTNRAKAVVDYLASKGIDAKRLSYKGYGSSKPIADNNTEEGKAKNRRTEFLIIKM